MLGLNGFAKGVIKGFLTIIIVFFVYEKELPFIISDGKIRSFAYYINKSFCVRRYLLILWVCINFIESIPRFIQWGYVDGHEQSSRADSNICSS